MITQLGSPQTSLVQDEHLSSAAKAKICCSSLDHYPTKEHSPSRPHVNPVSTAAVHISVQVTLDAVWNASICHGKQAFIRQDWLAMVNEDVERVAVIESAS